MIQCNSELLRRAIANLGRNGRAKFAAMADVSLSTVNLCLSGGAPKQAENRIRIASAAKLDESLLFESRTHESNR